MKSKRYAEFAKMLLVDDSGRPSLIGLAMTPEFLLHLGEHKVFFKEPAADNPDDVAIVIVVDTTVEKAVKTVTDVIQQAKSDATIEIHDHRHDG